jgi:hypothetical protein
MTIGQWADHDGVLHGHRRMAIAGVDATFLRPSLRLTRAAARMRAAAGLSLYEEPPVLRLLQLSFERQVPVATLLRAFQCATSMAVADAVVAEAEDVRLMQSVLNVRGRHPDEQIWRIDLRTAQRVAHVEGDADVEWLRLTLDRYGLAERIPWLTGELPDLEAIRQHRFGEIAALAPFSLPPVTVAQASAAAGVPVREVISELRSLLPRHWFEMPGPDSDHVADERDVAMLQALARDAQGCPACSTASYLARFAVDWPDGDVDDLVVRNAAPAGIPVALAAAHLVQIASREQRSLGFIEDVVCRRLSRHLRSSPLPPGCRPLRPAEPEVRLLLEGADTADPRFRERIPVRELVRYARRLGGTIGEAIAEIEPYSSIGGTVPSYADRDLLGYHPDVYDEVALDEVERAVADTGRSTATDHVTATHLMLVAARFGWPLPEAYDRLDRFAALGTTIGCDRATLPDGIVMWQDILVMSVELDALEPPLSGTVGAAEVARAAEAVREEPVVTWERIRRYAPMFGLTLDER